MCILCSIFYRAKCGLRRKRVIVRKLMEMNGRKKECILNKIKFLLIFIPEIVFITILNIFYTHNKYKVFIMSKVK